MLPDGEWLGLRQEKFGVLRNRLFLFGGRKATVAQSVGRPIRQMLRKHASNEVS